jgi:hypothetical protein
VISDSFHHELPESRESLCPSADRHGNTTAHRPKALRSAGSRAETSATSLKEGVRRESPSPSIGLTACIWNSAAAQHRSDCAVVGGGDSRISYDPGGWNAVGCAACPT